MVREFLTIICSDGIYLFLVGIQEIDRGFRNQISPFLRELSKQDEFTLPFNQAEQRSFVFFPDDGANLPVTNWYDILANKNKKEGSEN